jgi:RNA polymerase sigma-70 factor (ECF subfamily)
MSAALAPALGGVVHLPGTDGPPTPTGGPVSGRRPDAAGSAGRGNRAAADRVISDVETWTPPTWDEVVREHSARVYRLAYRLTGNQHDAEDLTQEVFVRVFRSLADYRPGTFEGWLHRITTNLFLDMVRRRARIRFEGLPDDAERVPSNAATPAQVYDDTHLDADVQSALDALLPEYRAAVVLCDVEGLSYEEIADVLDVKIGTVRSRIHRGRSQLRTALAHRAPRARHEPGEGAGS